jgi:hypothetical protein
MCSRTRRAAPSAAREGPSENGDDEPRAAGAER